jgi:hypothetical protein
MLIKATLKLSGKHEMIITASNFTEVEGLARWHNAKKIIVDGKVYLKNELGHWGERKIK